MYFLAYQEAIYYCVQLLLLSNINLIVAECSIYPISIYYCVFKIKLIDTKLALTMIFCKVHLWCCISSWVMFVRWKWRFISGNKIFFLVLYHFLETFRYTSFPSILIFLNLCTQKSFEFRMEIKLDKRLLQYKKEENSFPTFLLHKMSYSSFLFEPKDTDFVLHERSAAKNSFST